MREVPLEHFVTIPKLPAGLVFPKDLAERIRHDADRGRLVHRGFMSKADFDRLSALSDDWAYRRPLEELFRLCTPEPARPRFLARLGSVFLGTGL